jgi:hypothetical protein
VFNVLAKGFLTRINHRRKSFGGGKKEDAMGLGVHFVATERGVIVTAILLLLVTAGVAAAEKPPETKVTFDASYIVECRDVTPKPGKGEPDPSSKLIEATFRFSVNIDGDASRVKEVLVEIESPDSTLRVAKILDTTTLVKRTKGPITVRKVVSSQNSEREVSGAVRYLLTPRQGGVDGKAETKGSSTSLQAEESYERESPKDPSLIPTTLTREHGVRFKLRAHDQDVLEGIKEFTVRFEAPLGWRGDWVKVVCKARDDQGSEGTSFGEWALPIGLYLSGESSAKIEAETLGNVQLELDRRYAKSIPWDEAFQQKYIDALKNMKGHSR